MTTYLHRRGFLRLAGSAAAMAAAGSALSACAVDESPGQPVGAGIKNLRKVKLGFIALTDCAPLIAAKELGYFAERGLDVELIKQASWPATRDNLLSGEIDGGHVLFSMPLSVATGIGGKAGTTSLKIAMVLNNNGQAITLKKAYGGAAYGDLSAAKSLLEKEKPKLAMTFPGGTHDTWLRYWLKATKADLSNIQVSAVPPPQMVSNMAANNQDGYCVGEPWNAVAVQKGIGFTHITTQDIWQHHPEKALVVGARLTQDQGTLAEVMKAILKACKWLDDLANRDTLAGMLSPVGYVNAPAADIRGRLLGQYDLGAGLGTKTYTGDQMMFFRDGETPYPRRSHVYWFLAQYQRFGLVKDAPDYAKLADELILHDLYAKVATDEGIKIPDDDMAPFHVKLDNVTFDPKNVEDEAKRP
ncbi:CmpA/NrtA family ABC transporter substrate-binding protein [Micromonospora sp. KC213]|uniref:CmpA/NrtA family ABC transporter substrate-binding protein n=1 Tax=Micromonospora sp. KC213 TaxID=2530378 RepID=UPI0010483D0B|nr:CmpA/NrtA family ABC transporter substrate-binding protein [Micromonospora sp. KC213]TDC42183.1 nitrate ABC transporter substrate-binding protein [Micromonospora sp. KC213]